MTATTQFDDLARTKLTRVLGAAEGEAAFIRALTKLKLSTLQSADDLYLLADALKADTTMVAAVGAMLSLSAVIKGADPAKLAAK